MKRFSALVMTAGLLTWLTACKTSDSITSPDEAIESPVGTWQLTALRTADGSLVAVPNPSRYTLELGADGRASIRADCNVCGGEYEITGSAIDFGLMACTLALCAPGSLEPDYRAALETSSTFVRSGNRLSLTHDGGVLQFETP